MPNSHTQKSQGHETDLNITGLLLFLLLYLHSKLCLACKYVSFCSQVFYSLQVTFKSWSIRSLSMKLLYNSCWIKIGYFCLLVSCHMLLQGTLNHKELLFRAPRCSLQRDVHIHTYMCVKSGNKTVPCCIRPAQKAEFPTWRESYYFNFHFHPKIGQEIKISMK